MDSVTSRLRELFRSAEASNHRRCLVLCGEQPWVIEQAARLIDAAGISVTWVGSPERCPAQFEPVPANLARGLLGQQTQFLVVDCFDGVDPDAIGAVSGTLVGGGVLLLLRNAWGVHELGPSERRRLTVLPFSSAQVSAHFQNRFWRRFTLGTGTAVFDQRQGFVVDAPAEIPEQRRAPFVHDVAKTPDQLAALKGIMKVATGRRRRPLVIVSDRGRGKSSVLGLAAGERLRDHGGQILLVAPSRASAAPVFEHAFRVWSKAQWRGEVLSDGPRKLSLKVPSALTRELPSADLVLVDEAAALPAPLLRRLLDRYPRIVFATTLHGYEGTGHGFAVRFRSYLDEKTPSWNQLEMTEPIRWSANCPVEASIVDGLALKAEPCELDSDWQLQIPLPRVTLLDSQSLVEDDSTLQQVFGLLVSAHYRTAPADLQRMLDAPNMKVFALTVGPCVLGAALVAVEGGLPESLAREIFRGRRRPLGHLLPETLEAYLGIHGASMATAWRIVRIAIHPNARRRGLGKQLLTDIIGHSESSGVDYVGAAFGMTPQLLDFWIGSQFRLCRLGVRRGSSSGLHSAVVVCANNAEGREIASAAQERFERTAATNLAGPWRDLDWDSARGLIEHLNDLDAPGVNDDDLFDVVGFSQGARPFSVVLDALRRYTFRLIGQPSIRQTIPEASWRSMFRYFIQQWPASEVMEELALSGQAELERLMAEGFKASLGCEQGRLYTLASEQFGRVTSQD